VTYEVIIRPTAEDDLDEASKWYEKKQPGLGKRFFAAVDETIEKIRNWPEFGIVVYKAMRRANVRRFPYGVFYVLRTDRVIVVGVLHGRRAPRKWKSRLE
jgi:plasmid stabilization system protein ParE